MREDVFSPGDPVAVLYNGRVRALSRVKRVLKRDLVLENGGRFRLNGHGFGTWSITQVVHAGPRYIEEFRKRKAIATVQTAKEGELMSLDLSDLEAMAEKIRAARTSVQPAPDSEGRE